MKCTPTIYKSKLTKFTNNALKQRLVQYCSVMPKIVPQLAVDKLIPAS